MSTEHYDHEPSDTDTESLRNQLLQNIVRVAEAVQGIGKLSFRHETHTVYQPYVVDKLILPPELVDDKRKLKAVSFEHSTYPESGVDPPADDADFVLTMSDGSQCCVDLTSPNDGSNVPYTLFASALDGTSNEQGQAENPAGGRLSQGFMDWDTLSNNLSVCTNGQLYSGEHTEDGILLTTTENQAIKKALAGTDFSQKTTQTSYEYYGAEITVSEFIQSGRIKYTVEIQSPDETDETIACQAIIDKTGATWELVSGHTLDSEASPPVRADRETLLYYLSLLGGDESYDKTEHSDTPENPTGSSN